MSEDEFIKTYIPNTNLSSISMLSGNTEINLDNIICSNGNVSMTAKLITAENGEKEFDIIGSLYSGYKKQVYGLPSIVVDVEENNSGVKVLYFEIMDAPNDHLFLVNPALSSVSNFKLYLTYCDKLYLFEGQLPSELKGIDDSTLIQLPDPLKDSLWFAPFVDPIVETIPVDTYEEIPEMYGVGSTTNWSGGTVYQTRYNAFGITYLHSSMPFGNYRVNNVTNSDTTWKAYFYVNESVLADGVKVNGVENLIRYKNVCVNMACGKDTEFLRTNLDGQIYKLNGNFTTLNVAFDILTSKLNWWGTASNIMNVLSALSDSGKDIKIGSGASVNVNSGTTGVGIKLPKEYVLFTNSYSSSATNNVQETSSSHSLKFQGVLSSDMQSGSTLTTTTGCVQFSWDAYLNSTFEQLATGVKKTFTFTYTAK